MVTRPMWDALQKGESHDLLEEQSRDQEEKWNMVDKNTMDRKQFSRMQRHSVVGHASQDNAGSSEMKISQVTRKRKKMCSLTGERGHVKVDFRAVGVLKGFLTEDLKVIPRRRNGLSAKAQRKLARAVKTARTMGLLHPEPKPMLTLEEMLEIDRNLPG